MPKGGGYLFLRGDVWWGRVRVAGREYRSTLRTSDRREAVRRLKTWRLALERQTLGEAPAHSWEEAAVRWGDEILPKAVKAAVAKRYLVSIKQLTASFAGTDIAKISGPDIANYIGRRSAHVSNATINRDLTALSRLLSACVAWGWRTDNPARLYDRSMVRERRDPIHPPRPEDVERVLQTAPPGMAAILRALDQSGMREMEVVTLSAEQIDWRTETVTLLKTKTNRPRVLPFRTVAGDLGAALETARGRQGAVFLSERGTAYSGPSFSAGVGRIMRGLVAADPSFRSFRVHDLRHGFAVRWLRAGGDIYALSRHLGHSSVKTTEIYLGYLPQRGQS